MELQKKTVRVTRQQVQLAVQDLMCKMWITSSIAGAQCDRIEVIIEPHETMPKTSFSTWMSLNHPQVEHSTLELIQRSTVRLNSSTLCLRLLLMSRRHPWHIGFPSVRWNLPCVPTVRFLYMHAYVKIVRGASVRMQTYCHYIHTNVHHASLYWAEAYPARARTPIHINTYTDIQGVQKSMRATNPLRHEWRYHSTSVGRWTALLRWTELLLWTWY